MNNANRPIKSVENASKKCYYRKELATNSGGGYASLDEILHTLRRLKISRSELLVFQALLTVDASLRGLRPAAGELLAEFRARLHELLGALLRRAAHATATAAATAMTAAFAFSPSLASKLGDLYLLAPSIVSFNGVGNQKKLLPIFSSFNLPII